jgi:phosphoglycolate phosphatase
MGAQEGIPLKPDPTSAITITNLLKTPAQEFFYLGDTSTDMETAAAAGMVPVGARWGFRSEEELKQGGAQLIVKHPLDLLDHLS